MKLFAHFFNPIADRHRFKIRWQTFFPIFLIVGAFLVINGLTLLEFPRIHSDELWLLGTAEAFMHEGTFKVTEPFFDLYPRVIHPFRWLYLLMESGVISILGNTAFAMRFLSLLAASAALIAFYKTALTRFSNTSGGHLIASVLTIVLALNVQWLYASRFGRQDMIILMLVLIGFFSLSRPNGKAWFPALLVCLGIGVHPNSFLIAAVFFAVMGIQVLSGKRPLRSLVTFFALVASGAALYLIIGYRWNPHLLSEYFSYGASLGIEIQATSRLTGFFWFWYKLYYRIGGTYDLFDIRTELTVFTAALAVSVCLLTVYFLRRQNRSEIDLSALQMDTAAFIALLAGLLIIGRYNQTSVVFLFPFGLLLTASALQSLFKLTGRFLPSDMRAQIASAKWTYILCGLLVSLSLLGLRQDLQSYFDAQPYQRGYAETLAALHEIIPADAIQLSNINVIEGFDPYAFYDIRNLALLEENGLSLSEYIEARGIEYIVLHDEMGYMEQTSPRWDFIYGTLDFMPALHAFIDERTTLVAAIDDPTYGMRIAKYVGTYPWETRIYRVLPDESKNE